jgi:hypothetical protein
MGGIISQVLPKFATNHATTRATKRDATGLERQNGTNAATIRERLNRRPFEPFELRLSNGEAFSVRDPEVIAVGKNRLAIVDPEMDASCISR